MRILLVAPHYPPHYAAGVELYTQRLARWLTAHGHAVTVAAVEHLVREAGGVAVAMTREATPDADVCRLTVRHDTFRATFAGGEAEAWWREFLREARPEVIHLHSGYLLGGPVLAAAAAASIPVVVTLHDFWFICARVTLQQPAGACCSGPTTPAKCAWCLHADRRRVRVLDQVTQGRASQLASALLSLGSMAAVAGYTSAIADAKHRRACLLAALETAHAIISPSRFLAAQMEAAGVQGGRIDVRPYGIDARFERQPPRRPSSTFRVAYLGQVAWHKGVHVAIDAIRRCRDPRVGLSIHGSLDREPEYVAELRRLAADDTRIRFAGGYVRDDLPAILHDADTVVVPSIWYENYPFVILEAHAAGVPVLASRHGGMQEMVRDGEDGVLFEVGNAGALAGVVTRLAADPALVERLAAGCRPHVSSDEEFTNLEVLYARAAAARGR